jgi:septal ring factor EnvC (AmiA/AmiB activator)
MAMDAAALRAAADAARDKAVAAEAEARELARAEAAARAAATALDAELRDARRRRSAARDAETDAAGRAAEAAARAADLEGALVRLEREAREEARREAQRAATAAPRDRPAPEPREAAAAAVPAPDPPARPARGGRVLPVAGQVAREFGAEGEGGPSRGLTFQAPPGARVVSPCAGKVAFAAPFRSYGRLLIVDCGDGYHFVLGGLDRLDASPGQKVLAGEPVGLLGGASTGAGTADGPGRATLYVELRRRGDPVDPRPWFAARG